MEQDQRHPLAGSSYDDLRDFPAGPSGRGFQLSAVCVEAMGNRGRNPDDVGPGTREIRVSYASGAFRVIYVAKFEEAVYVLHCFQKKSQLTSRHDKDIASALPKPWSGTRKANKQDR